jgi:hypothetical protein
MDKDTQANIEREKRRLAADAVRLRSLNDNDKADDAERQLKAIKTQLSRGTNVHGRSRSMPEPVERCRDRVKKAIQATLDSMKSPMPLFHQHLVESIATPSGYEPCYRPKRSVHWTTA